MTVFFPYLSANLNNISGVNPININNLINNIELLLYLQNLTILYEIIWSFDVFWYVFIRNYNDYIYD